MVAPTSGPTDTCPSPFASPGMLLLSALALSAWLPLAAPLYLLKALLYCALAAPEAYLSLTQYARRTVRPGEGYALVTGASSGIGADIARELARAGFDLILVARRADRLEALADELRGLSKRKLDVRTLPRDLTQAAQVSTLCAELESTPVVILVNNAGLGATAPYCEQEFETIAAMLQVNVRAVAELTHAFSRRMVRRHASPSFLWHSAGAHAAPFCSPAGCAPPSPSPSSQVRAGRGHILNVSSIAGLSPGPTEAAYHAAKAFVLSLSEALSYELRATGVTVTALCPGPVATEFWEVAKSTRSRFALLPITLSSPYVAAVAVRAMFAGRSMAIPGMAAKAIEELVLILPRTFTVYFNAVGWSKV